MAVDGSDWEKRVRMEELRSKDFYSATLGRHRTSGGGGDDMKTVSTVSARPCGN